MKWRKNIFGFAIFLLITFILNRFAIDKLGALTVGGIESFAIIFTALSASFYWIFFGLLYVGVIAGAIVIGRQFNISNATCSGVVLSILIGCYQVVQENHAEQVLKDTADREMNERVKAEYNEMNTVVLAAKAMDRQKIEDGLKKLKFRSVPDAICRVTKSSQTTALGLIRIDGAEVKNPESLNEEQLLNLAELMPTLHVAEFDMQQILISILIEIGVRRASKESYLSRWIALWKAVHPSSTSSPLTLVEPSEKKLSGTNGCAKNADDIADTISHYWGANGIKMAADMGLLLTAEQKRIVLKRALTSSDFRVLKDAGISLTDVPNETWLPSVINELYGKLIGERSAGGTISSSSEVVEVFEELARQGADFSVVDERGDNICKMVLQWQSDDDNEARIEAIKIIQKTACQVKGNQR